MDWQYTGLAIAPVLAGVCSLSLATYAWSRRERNGAVALVILLLGVAVWCLAYAAELSSSSLWGKVLWAKAQYLGIVVVPVGWFTFVVQYTGGERWLRLRTVAWLAVVPAATLLLAWTNELHHLIWVQIGLSEQVGGLTAWRATYGWGFWVHTVYSYAMLLLGALILVQVLVRSPRFYGRRVSLLLLSAALPWVGNLLSVFGLVSLPLDLTPLGFAGAGVLLLLALFRVRLLDVSLVARDTVVESIADGLLVLDDQDRVIDLNPAAERMLGCPGPEMVGQPLEADYYQRIRHMVSSNGLAERVVFTDRREDMPAVLASLDVLVTLSGGSVMIEAMACGTAVISAGFTRAEYSRIVKDGQTGLLVESNRTEELQAALLRIIEDPTRRDQMGRQGREHVEKIYSHKELVSATQRLYDELL